MSKTSAHNQFWNLNSGIGICFGFGFWDLGFEARDVEFDQ
jgi:hypothetical protein